MQYNISFTLTDCTEGDIRLEGTDNPLTGRVEVCHDGVWGTVCSDFWSKEDATVACRKLGYSSTGIVYYCIMHL